MRRYVAFLRGMNLGGRRITNEELRACFDAMGFTSVSAFLASGNLVFDAPGGTKAQIAARIEKGLAAALGYDVPTFLRTADEVRAIATHEVFAADLERSAGKLQVAMLGTKPSAASRRKVLALDTEADRLEVHGRELYWLPCGKLTESDLDMRAIDRALGPMTLRTRRTVERLAAKFLGD